MTPHDLPEVVYTPESSLRRPGALLASMVRDLRASRELAWRLFVRDVQAQYRQSLLGYLWLLLPPVVSTLLFVFLRSNNVFRVGQTDIPYPAYVLTGTILWAAFSASITAPLRVVTGSASMLSKLNFPREALLLSSVYQVLFDLSVRLVLLVVVFAWLHVSVPTTILLAPLGILALVLFGFVLGLLLVPLGMLYGDVSRGLTTALGAWFFVTPVIYPPPTTWPASLLSEANPVSPLIITAREMLTTGRLTCLPGFLAISAVAATLLLIGWVLYRLAMPHLIARMSA